MSIFFRIFLFFWLTAALIASSFFVLGRLSGSEFIDRRYEVLSAQAITVSTLWQQGGSRLIRQWLRQLPHPERPIVIDLKGKSLFTRRGNHKLRPEFNMTIPVEEGIQYLPHGRISLVAAIPDIEPVLFLFTQLEANQLNRIPMWLRFLFALIIISLISYLLATALSRRIRLLRQAVQGFSKGDLGRRVQINGNDEVSELASDFNRMADHVHDMLDSQRQLVSDVSHELRSPLARLRIALELAQRAKNSNELLPRIEKETDELEQLVTEVLSLARIKSGQYQLERQKTDLQELLRQIVHDANFEGEQKQLTVQLSSVGEVMLEIDPVLIRSAIENVIRNAIRHAPEKSIIEVSTRFENNHLEIIIEDSGPGVPESELAMLFKPFARVADARDRHSGGFGLGLAIAGRSLLAHNGRARAENRSEGGLRIILTLPLEFSKNE